MSKRTRQQAIVELVARKKIPSQAALAEELRKTGYQVTQATLSRDIAELNLVKAKSGYTRPQDASQGGAPPAPDAVGTLKRLVTKVDSAFNQVVVRTSPGGAGAVALALDDRQYDGVLGTVAGDDTILIVARSVETAAELRAKLSELLR
jgi:transcriptional regulator of arginine metabolism